MASLSILQASSAPSPTPDSGMVMNNGYVHSDVQKLQQQLQDIKEQVRHLSYEVSKQIRFFFSLCLMNNYFKCIY